MVVIIVQGEGLTRRLMGLSPFADQMTVSSPSLGSLEPWVSPWVGGLGLSRAPFMLEALSGSLFFSLPLFVQDRGRFNYLHSVILPPAVHHPTVLGLRRALSLPPSPSLTGLGLSRAPSQLSIPPGFVLSLGWGSPEPLPCFPLP